MGGSCEVPVVSDPEASPTQTQDSPKVNPENAPEKGPQRTPKALEALSRRDMCVYAFVICMQEIKKLSTYHGY